MKYAISQERTNKLVYSTAISLTSCIIRTVYKQAGYLHSCNWQKGSLQLGSCTLAKAHCNPPSTELIESQYHSLLLDNVCRPVHY